MMLHEPTALRKNEAPTITGDFDQAQSHRLAEPSLFDFRYPDAAGYKTAVPETSMAAAASIESEASQLRRDVLALLRAGAYTADEVAAKLGKSILAIRPRCSELRAQGKIIDSGIRRPNSSGKPACAWKAVA